MFEVFEALTVLLPKSRATVLRAIAESLLQAPSSFLLLSLNRSVHGFGDLLLLPALLVRPRRK